jgi:hypothetical protein
MTGPSTVGQILQLQYGSQPPEELSLPGTGGHWNTLPLHKEAVAKRFGGVSA